MKDFFQKFHFKNPGIVMNAPPDWEKDFMAIGFKNEFERNKPCGNIIVFVKNKKELIEFLKKDFKKVIPDGVLWLAYPKITSKMKTDFHRDSIRMMAEEYGISAVSAVSLDTVWSALRFRPKELVMKK